MSVANTYLAGAQVLVSTYVYPAGSPVIGGFRDQNGVLTDPSTVTLKYRVNQAAVATLTYPTGITKAAVGLYYAILDTTALPGTWVYEWIGSGSLLTGPRANSFNVVPPPI